MEKKIRGKERHLILFGTSLVGKGRCTKDLVEQYPGKLFVIGIGEETRRRIAEDPVFREKHKTATNNGGLLPDSVADEIALDLLQKGRGAGFTSFIWDGFGRTEEQIIKMIEWRILDHLTAKCILLDATFRTLLKRHMHAKEHKTRQGREDEHCLKGKYDTFNTNWPGILSAMRLAGINPVIIDADQELSKVSEKVRFYAKQLLEPNPHKDQEIAPMLPPYKKSNSFSNLAGMKETANF